MSVKCETLPDTLYHNVAFLSLSPDVAVIFLKDIWDQVEKSENYAIVLHSSC